MGALDIKTEQEGQSGEIFQTFCRDTGGNNVVGKLYNSPINKLMLGPAG